MEVGNILQWTLAEPWSHGFRLIVLMGWEQTGTKIIKSVAFQGIFGGVQDIVHGELFLVWIVLGWI